MHFDQCNIKATDLFLELGQYTARLILWQGSENNMDKYEIMTKI